VLLLAAGVALPRAAGAQTAVPFSNASLVGFDAPGKWAEGVYRVACTSNGRWIADSAFQIY
jgi:hypothetical protein